MSDSSKKTPLTSNNLVRERLAGLKDLIPEAFTEGEVDFEKLRLALGDVVETASERYGLTWAGKADATRSVQVPSTGTLEPTPEASNGFETAANLVVEGDNLEVLKLLQTSYEHRVKMIYIDPPYNTGKEFIYSDNYREGLRHYLRYTGQVDRDGVQQTATLETEGRHHSRWLNMMYPRLFLARTLLRDDGCIFVSIDDTEVKNLRALMDELFGEENFVATIIWEKKYAPQNDALWLSDNHDYVLLYAKRKAIWRPQPLPRTRAANARYTNPDHDPRGPWKPTDLSVKTYAAAQDYPITVPSGRVVEPPEGRCWSVSRARYDALVADNRIWFGAKGSAVPSLKRFLSEVKSGMTSLTIWKRDEVGDSQQGRRTLRDLFGDTGVFDTPKSVGLLKKMLQLGTEPSEDDLVLDFFAGSGTLAQAVIEQNDADAGNRKFILVQLPEQTGRRDFKTIAEVTRARVDRVIAARSRLSPEMANRAPVGYRAFRLGPSHWHTETTSHNLSADPVKANSTEAGLLFEIMLKSGLPLSASIETVPVGELRLYRVDDAVVYVGGAIRKGGAKAFVDAVVSLAPKRLLCLSRAFNGDDALETNTISHLNDHPIDVRML